MRGPSTASSHGLLMDLGNKLTHEAADLFGLAIAPEQAAALDQYASLLSEWNTHTNLTAITDPDAVRVRHFLDSLALAKTTLLRDQTRLIDIGSGAGFPGLVLAIVYPHIHATLLEATGKKVTFIRHVVDTLGLKNALPVKGRAEEFGHLPQHRAHYNVVLARAVARLPALVEYMLPLARVGGFCVAMKGSTAEEESQNSRSALRILGGRIHETLAYQLPDVPQTHHLIIIEKTDATPPPYPRNPGIPTRKPL